MESHGKHELGWDSFIVRELVNVCYVCLQSDFLDHYVSYLRELPECLTVISLFSSSKAALLEVQIHTF